MKLINKIALLSLVISLAGSKMMFAQSLRDIEGNLYATTTIGKQTWMAENLKVTKYNDGTPIPLVPDDKKWKVLTSPGFCWFNNNAENKELYGALYNWYTVNTKKLCPKGWHVPTNAEWGNLITFLGDQLYAGDKLKETGSEHWKNSATIATDEFNFTALPAGIRIYTGFFSDIEGSITVFWTSTERDDDEAWNSGLYFSSSKLFNGFDFKRAGFSVRCMKDVQ